MVASMTGFGRSLRQSSNYSIQVEIKTVNHRYREYHIKLPASLSHAEIALRNVLAKHFGRGRIEVNVKLAGNISDSRDLYIDWNLLDRYYQFVKEAKARYNLSSRTEIEDLLQFEEAVHIQENEGPLPSAVDLLLEAAEEAARQARKMRETEGESLSSILLSYISSLEELTEQAKEAAPIVIQTYTDRLKEKLQDLLQEQADEVRIVTEAAILADKADISEELTRLASHIFQFRETVHSDGPVGRKLDFIIQEMNREANTLGSKGNDANIAKIVVEMKVLIEKMREQVQNIE